MPKTRKSPNRLKTYSNDKNYKVDDEDYIVICKGKVDYIILCSVIILVFLGVTMVFSASYYYAETKMGNIFYFFRAQSMYAILGFILMWFVSQIDWRHFKNFSLLFFVISIFFLIIVLIPGIGIEKNGARRWLQFGPIGFQPSEVSKVALALYLSKFISKRKNILNTWRGFFKCCFIIAIPAVLIGIENRSTAIIVGTIGLSIVFVASKKIRYFLPIPIFGFLGILAMIVGGGFRAARIKAWLDPFVDSRGVGFQTVQSLYAIASGGFFGLGLGQSRQKLGFIPEGHNDIIFAIICEELGLAGAIIFVFLFAMIIWRGYTNAINATNAYMCYVATGITTMIAIQVVINIAVVTNTMPNTGVPLPFVSYGGTALLIMMSSIGIILNISRYFRK